MKSYRKYRNQTEVVDNIKFASLKEARRYRELKLMEKAGLISKLILQPRFPISIGGVKIMMLSKRYHKQGRQLVYVADFQYEENGKIIIEDTKGHLTEGYKIKRALMLAMGFEIIEL